MFKVYQNANQLPEAWDEIVAGSVQIDKYFLKRQTLVSLEQLNPCGQKYHIDLERKAVFVTYQHKLDLFTFTPHLSLKVPVTIVGLPLSVAKPGYAYKELQTAEMKTMGMQAIVEAAKKVKGFTIILNADRLNTSMAQGRTLASCILENRWQSFNHYLSDMRSHYRYRVKKALEKGSAIDIRELTDNREFTIDMYRLYEDVYQRSDNKLEKQSIEFFQQFPAKIITFSVTNKVVAFVQVVKADQELTFIFGGINYSLIETYDLYLNMILQIVRIGIELGVKRLDFGQTTEETKLKIGAKLQPKLIYAHHSNPIMNFLISKGIGALSYKDYAIKHNVFKT
ncbi:GNAT family N-acetyltransferase [Desulfuribacillus alkaliarsenatis]|uniref:BioF2-like acetyltransferase domain-containing protein n=1 Tax=Desulfuribacillus alkaliarsenatis TaxID=766136 RepID=A0A1E5G5C3_9FIRM|nr:GNAT family N-acetyltransferase [Desulfuribacillus alkaliarsenatis]OEF98366.1 hypothetical protein BHF68_01430 [Desulfuribacillus alkaliarsenatis]